MLLACGQQALAESLPRGFLHAGGDLGSREQIPQKQPGETAPTSSRSRLRLTDAVLRYSLDAGSRLTRRRRKVEDRLQRLMQKAQRALHLHAPALGDNETPDLVRLLKREEVGCRVLVGAAQGSWLSEAFIGAPWRQIHKRRWSSASTGRLLDLPISIGITPMRPSSFAICRRRQGDPAKWRILGPDRDRAAGTARSCSDDVRHRTVGRCPRNCHGGGAGLFSLAERGHDARPGVARVGAEPRLRGVPPCQGRERHGRGPLAARVA